MDIKEEFLAISNNYMSTAGNVVNKNLPIFSLIKTKIPTMLNDFLKEKNVSGIKIVGSSGVGVAPYYPWIAFLDERITDSPTKGFYVVILFSDDYKDLFLTINQGATIANKTTIKNYSDFVNSKISSIPSFTKGSLPEKSLVRKLPYKSTNKGALYEKTNLFYKQFSIEVLDNEIFLSDLLEIIHVYQNCVDEFIHQTNPQQSDLGISQLPLQQKIIDKENGSYIIDEFYKVTNEANIIFSKEFITRFIALLCTKPLVILTGLSGSGKTKLAQSFSNWISENEDQVCLLAVGSDWTNREPLFGYTNALEKGKYVLPDNNFLQMVINASKPENSKKPYFLILDEMNLSHVERYFADILSCMESEGKIFLHPIDESWKDEIPDSIVLPKNLFIIGTVNIDETTYMFSPKVLDRAGVIEFRVTEEELEDFLLNPQQPRDNDVFWKGSSFGPKLIEITNSHDLNYSNNSDLQIIIMEFFVELKKLGAEFGFRTALEIFQYASKISLLASNDKFWDINAIVDTAILQKLLPKIHGSRKKLDPFLKILAIKCFKENSVHDINIEEFLLNNSGNPVFLENIRFPLTLEKITRMYRRVIQDGFTSFAEA